MKDYNLLADSIVCEVEVSFDYASLDLETRVMVRQRTSEIKERMRRTAQDIIEIGQKLIDVKEHLGHGKFGLWLRLEFEWTDRTARQFMRVAEAFKSENFSDLNFAPSALYLLAAPSTPDDVRREALERAYQGESITHAKVKRLVAHAKVKRNAKKSKVVDAPVGTNSNESEETALSRPTFEQEFVLGEWVEVRTRDGNKSWDGLLGPVTRIENEQVTVQLNEDKWKHLRFYRDELVKVPAPNEELNRMIESAIAEAEERVAIAQGEAKSFYKRGDLVLIGCPTSAEIEYRQWNGCWGIVKRVGRSGSVEVVIGAKTVRFKASDLDMIDNPMPILKEIAEHLNQLLSRDDLDELDRQTLTFYQRRLVFTDRQLEVLADVWNHYTHPDLMR